MAVEKKIDFEVVDSEPSISVIISMNKHILKELEPLTPEEKLDVIEFLSVSLEEKDVPLSDAQRMIVREREEAYRTGKSKLFSWNEVKDSTKS